MKKEKVRIDVVGLSASGKSCVMFEIYKALKLAGFEVELDVEGQLDYPDEVEFMKLMLKNEKKRLEAVKEKSKIVLKEIRATRNLFPNGEKPY